MTILIVIFGEIIPKLLAKKYPEKGAIIFSEIILGIYILFYPITKVISSIIPSEKEVIFKSEDEFSEAIFESNEVGIIDKSENEIIKNVLEFDKDKVKNIMVLFDKIY